MVFAFRARARTLEQGWTDKSSIGNRCFPSRTSDTAWSRGVTWHWVAERYCEWVLAALLEACSRWQRDRKPLPPALRSEPSSPPGQADDDWAFLRHAGVEYVSVWTTIQDIGYEAMMRTRRLAEANGIRVYNIGITDLHCDPTIVLGLKGVDKKIDQYRQYLRNLGKAGIHYTTYAHMANIKNQPVPGYYQTGRATGRGGADAREFDLEAARKLPRSFDRPYSEDHIWGTFTDFMQAVIPVAEEAGVRIGFIPMTRRSRRSGAWRGVFGISRPTNAPWKSPTATTSGFVCAWELGPKRHRHGQGRFRDDSSLRAATQDFQSALSQRRQTFAEIPRDLRGRRLP